MIAKFENFAKEEEEKERLSSPPGSPQSNGVCTDGDGEVPTTPLTVKDKKGKEQTFERSIFDPDKYIEFNSAVRNIISFN